MNKQDNNPIKLDCKLDLNMSIQIKADEQRAGEAVEILARGARWLLILTGLAILFGTVLYFAQPYFQAA
ncbi:hypothetical protein BWP33_07515 [Simonsiella muelleri ATCC 29453]|nr:hypothetical protein BWP33_07515 [Simonsiella muelleri ATCC 29453]